MIERSFSIEKARQYAGMMPQNLNGDWDGWINNYRNVLALSGDNAGMATFEYPGFYNIHWFFTARGKEALNLAKEMLDYFFTNYDVKTIRGLTPVKLKNARWLARQVGLTSYGLMDFPDGQYELFCMTKDEFYMKGNK